MSINPLIYFGWTICQIPEDSGKLLSLATDIIFCQSPRHSRIEQFAKGATVPIVNISSCQFVSLNILSDLLTLQQHFGRVNGLTIAWIGPPCPELNTYLSVTPLLGIHMKFLCQCGGPMSPANIHHLRGKDNVYREKLKECKDLKEVLSGAQVIITRKHTEKSLTLRKSDLDQYADKYWVFLETLPRSSIEVDEDIFQSGKNLIWKSFVNTKWVCAAIISRFLDSAQNGNY
ncbi:hypothetical protein JTB14_008238 [Gonioctena quinquepunctata]|nr:hypothetical protein JTB14_008238 [Gonioctena quinquepunctata]